MAFLRGRANTEPVTPLPKAAPRFAPFARFRQQPPAAAASAVNHVPAVPAAGQEQSSRLPDLPAGVARLLPCLACECPCTACGSTLELHGRGRLGDCNACGQRDATEPLNICHECSTCGRRQCVACSQMQIVRARVADANGQKREEARLEREALQAKARDTEERTQSTRGELASTRDEHATASGTLASFKEASRERRALLSVELAGGRGALAQVLNEAKAELEAKELDLQALQLRLSVAKAAIPGPTLHDVEMQENRKEFERLCLTTCETLGRAAKSEAYVREAERGDAELQLELARFREERARAAARQVLSFVGLRAELVVEKANAAVAKANADALADEACAVQAAAPSLPAIPARARAYSAPPAPVEDAGPILHLDDFLNLQGMQAAGSRDHAGAPNSLSSSGIGGQKSTMSEQLSEQLAPAAAGAAASAGRIWGRLQRLAEELDPMPPVIVHEPVPTYYGVSEVPNAETGPGGVGDLRSQRSAWERKLDGCAQQLDWMEQQLHARDAEVYLLTNDVGRVQRDLPTLRAAATQLKQELQDERQQMKELRERLQEELRQSVAACRKQVEARFLERPRAAEAQQRSDLEGVFGDSADWASPAGPSVGLGSAQPSKSKGSSLSFSMNEGYVSAGDDLLVAQLTIEEAKLRCETLGSSCAGFTFQSKAGSDDGTYRVFFKRKWDLHGKGQATGWLSFRREEDIAVLPDADVWLAAATGANSVHFAAFDALRDELSSAADRTAAALKAVPRRPSERRYSMDSESTVPSEAPDEEGLAHSERRHSIDDAEGGARFLSMATPPDTPPRSRENSWGDVSAACVSLAAAPKPL